MKSNSVSNVFGAVNLPSMQETGAVMQPKQSFDAVLNSQTGTENEACVMDMSSENASVSEVQKTFEKERSEVSGREIAKAEDASEKQISTVESNKEKLEDKVKKLLSEELGISEEELENVMETLGITLDSLINGTGLKDLMMELTGAEDVSELLLSDNFGSLMTKLESLIQDFSQQFGMTSEEFKTVLAQVEASADMVSTDNEEIMIATDSEETMVTAGNEGSVVTDVSEQINEQGQNEADFSQTEKNYANSENTLIQDEHTAGQVSYKEVQTTVNTVGEQITQVVEQSFVDAEDIMRQISHFTKVTVQQTQSSIEMQLNPAHLGKIHLQVATKNGMITAQLAAENEAVKQALENQLTALKENMNQQGLKVEAVEVTIASHEFEQNLEGHQQSAQENAQQENSRTQRFLTADNLEELSGFVSEEEKIVTQMMRDNGNSMDVTA